MNIDANKYNITIRRDVFEGEVLFEARVKELPDLAEYGESFEEAYDLAIDTIETSAEVFAEKGRAFPPAIVPVDDYSGRVTLRLPLSLHRAMSEMAEEEKVSLNQHLVNVLSNYSGFATGAKLNDSTDEWQAIRCQPLIKKKLHSHLKLVYSEDLSKEKLQAVH